MHSDTVDNGTAARVSRAAVFGVRVPALILGLLLLIL
jgi:hypothetical protein